MSVPYGTLHLNVLRGTKNIIVWGVGASYRDGNNHISMGIKIMIGIMTAIN